MSIQYTICSIDINQYILIMYKHLVKMSLNKKIEVIHDPYVRDMCLDIVYPETKHLF